MRWAWALGMAVQTLAVTAATTPGASETRSEDTATFVPYVVSGDAIPEPLGGRRGDAGRGRELIGARHQSLCVLCHALPEGAPALQGTLAPSLAGIGSRLDEGQIRLRIVDMRRLYPESIMPAYHRPAAGARIAPAWQGKPVLGAAEIEHLVAYLVTLKE